MISKSADRKDLGCGGCRRSVKLCELDCPSCTGGPTSQATQRLGAVNRWDPDVPEIDERRDVGTIDGVTLARQERSTSFTVGEIDERQDAAVVNVGSDTKWHLRGTQVIDLLVKPWGIDWL